jgi:hypothetical protein
LRTVQTLRITLSPQNLHCSVPLRSSFLRAMLLVEIFKVQKDRQLGERQPGSGRASGSVRPVIRAVASAGAVNRAKDLLRQMETTLGGRRTQPSPASSATPTKARRDTSCLPATLPRVEFAVTHSQHRALIFLPATRSSCRELASLPVPRTLAIDGMQSTARGLHLMGRRSRDTDFMLTCRIRRLPGKRKHRQQT